MLSKGTSHSRKLAPPAASMHPNQKAAPLQPKPKPKPKPAPSRRFGGAKKMTSHTHQSAHTHSHTNVHEEQHTRIQICKACDLCGCCECCWRCVITALRCALHNSGHHILPGLHFFLSFSLSFACLLDCLVDCGTHRRCHCISKALSWRKPTAKQKVGKVHFFLGVLC